MHNAVTLEAQLAEARSNNAQLQSEVEKLNDTVFSKTFRAPSAWAEREVKYKMEKKDWDTQVEQFPEHLSHASMASILLMPAVHNRQELGLQANQTLAWIHF